MGSILTLLTDAKKLTQDNMIALLMDASLQPIDSFFEIVRRRVSMLERPVHSPSNAGRIWTGNSPYKPAKRIGLAKGKVEIRRILYP